MTAKQWFYRQGQRRGAMGRICRGKGGLQDWWPDFAQDAFTCGWFNGRYGRV